MRGPNDDEVNADLGLSSAVCERSALSSATCFPALGTKENTSCAQRLGFVRRTDEVAN